MGSGYAIPSRGATFEASDIQAFPIATAAAGVGSLITAITAGSGTETWEIVGLELTTSVPIMVAVRSVTTGYLIGNATLGAHTEAGKVLRLGYLGTTEPGENLGLYNRGNAAADVVGVVLARKLED